MDIEKTIKANKIFLTIQTIAFVVDIILSFVFDAGVYFIFMWICGLFVVIYNGLIQTLFFYKVICNNGKYAKIIKKYPYVFTDLRIYILARKMKDDKTGKVLSQGIISLVILLSNIIYVIIITVLLHPENID